MNDVEPVVTQELERLAPPRETGLPDWTDVILRTSVYARRRRYRSGHVAIVSALAFAIAAPAFALSAEVRGLFGLERPKPVLAQATWLVSAPVGNRFHAHVWTSPSSTGGRCEFMTIDHRAVAPAAPRKNGGGWCSTRRRDRAAPASTAVPLSVGVSISRRPRSGLAANWVPPIVDGAVLPTLRATRAEVIWNGGSLPLRVRNNRILGGSPVLYMPPFENFPYIVVVYNRQGNEIARKRLDSPALRLLGSWENYTREYKKWKKSRG